MSKREPRQENNDPGMPRAAPTRAPRQRPGEAAGQADGGAAWYKPRRYRDYLAAEKEADLMAGDTGLAMGVVKDYQNPGWLLVMQLDDAEAHTAEHDDDPDGARILHCAIAYWEAGALHSAGSRTAGPDEVRAWFQTRQATE